MCMFVYRSLLLVCDSKYLLLLWQERIGVPVTHMLSKHRSFSTTNSSINYAFTMCVCVSFSLCVTGMASFGEQIFYL